MRKKIVIQIMNRTKKISKLKKNQIKIAKITYKKAKNKILNLSKKRNQMNQKKNMMKMITKIITKKKIIRM